MISEDPPILFLAFANDRKGTGYLRNLAEEAHAIQQVLTSAEQAKLCQIIPRQNVTLDQVLGVFQDSRYRNRIALFHFAGHANDAQLLFETPAGAPAPTLAAGFASFLAEQRGLHLIFLNGCTTEPQVQALLNAGVAVVIATSQAIDDKVAANFAILGGYTEILSFEHSASCKISCTTCSKFKCLSAVKRPVTVSIDTSD